MFVSEIPIWNFSGDDFVERDNWMGMTLRVVDRGGANRARLVVTSCGNTRAQWFLGQKIDEHG
jgi:hypothetical protein